MSSFVVTLKVNIIVLFATPILFYYHAAVRDSKTYQSTSKIAIS